MNKIIAFSGVVVAFIALISGIISVFESRKRTPKTKEQRKQKDRERLTGTFWGVLVIACTLCVALY